MAYTDHLPTLSSQSSTEIDLLTPSQPWLSGMHCGIHEASEDAGHSGFFISREREREEPDVMAYTHYPSIWVAEAEHHREFQASPEYRMRPYLKTNKTKHRV